MYPGPDAPDLGVFVAQLERELVVRGNEVDLAVLDTRAGGKLRYLTLARRTLRARRPDVVYAHFLVPAGLIGALAGHAPLVVTAHGRDVRNIGAIPRVAAATRLVVRRAAAVICVSEYLRRELETKLPEARGKVEVVSSGVDRERFAVTEAPPGPPAIARPSTARAWSSFRPPTRSSGRPAKASSLLESRTAKTRATDSAISLRATNARVSAEA